MKILFINLPYYGHFIPTVGLVQEFIKQGHQVDYLMPFDWQDRVSESGANFLGFENHRKLDVQIRNAFFAAEKVIEKYDLVIYEQFFFVGKHLAEKHSKPVVRIFTAPATNSELMDKYINAGGHLGIFRHKWIGRAWTKSVVKGLDIKLKTDCWLDEINNNPPDINFVYTTKEFQPYAESFPADKFYFLGPSVYERKEDELSFVKSEFPVVYISFGTIVGGGTVLFKQCFEAFKAENVTVVMSVGKGCSIQKLGNIPDNFIVKNFVPQISILKQADVFVTHGGMNSVSEAMTYGVPMVVIPFESDQPTNGEQVVKLGLGKMLEHSKTDAAALRETVMSMLNEDKIKQNSAVMKDTIKNCLGNSGAVRLIEKHFL